MDHGTGTLEICAQFFDLAGHPRSCSCSNHWVRFSNRHLVLAYFYRREWGACIVLQASAFVPLVQNNGYNNTFFGWLVCLDYVSHSADIAERQQELPFSAERIVTNPKSTEIIRSLLSWILPCVFKINFQLIFPAIEFVRILRKGAVKEGPEQMQRAFFSSINKYLPITFFFLHNLLNVSSTSAKMWVSQMTADSLADCRQKNLLSR